jgi:hypothetical protein
MGCMQQHVYKKPLIITEHGIYTGKEKIIKSSWVMEFTKILCLSSSKKYTAGVMKKL